MCRFWSPIPSLTPLFSMATGLVLLAPAVAVAQDNARPDSVAADTPIHPTLPTDSVQPIHRLGAHLLLPPAPLDRSLSGNPESPVPESPLMEGEDPHGAIAQGVTPIVQPSSAQPSSVQPSENLSSPSLEADTAVPLDPELGLLRLRPLSGSSAVIDPELGVLRLRALAPPPERRSWLFLQSNISLFNGDNLLARADPIADNTLNSGISLRAVPRLGPRTFLVGTAGGSVFRYADNGEFDYNKLEFRLGVSHWLTRRAYLGLNWRNQQLFSQDGGDRFLDDHRLQASIGRTDRLTPDLKLATSYQLQSSWSNPVERSRLTNRFNVSLSHQLNPQMTASLSYQLALIDFTQRDRYDSYHQLLTQLQFTLSDQTTLSIFGGGRLGDSTSSQLDFDSTLWGLSFIMNLPLF